MSDIEQVIDWFENKRKTAIAGRDAYKNVAHKQGTYNSYESEVNALNLAISALKSQRKTKKHGKMLNINEMVTEAYQNAKAHGWHDDNKTTVIEFLCLIHSEVSEVVEEIRHGEPLDTNRIIDGKPEGVPSELADIVIRVADMCGLYGIDLESAIIEKMQYNKTRPYRHGGKTL